jgi:hypothetical protein
MPKNRSGIISGWLSIVTTLSLLTAIELQKFLTMRLAFLFTGIAGLIAVLIKYLISPYVTIFNNIQEKEMSEITSRKVPPIINLYQMFISNLKGILLIMFPLSLFHENYDFVNGKWWFEYVKRRCIENVNVEFVRSAGLVISLALKIILGWLADIFTIPIMLYSSLFFAILGTPINFYLTHNGMPLTGLVISLIPSCIFSGTFIKFMSDILSDKMSTTEIGSAWNLLTSVLPPLLNPIPSISFYSTGRVMYTILGSSLISLICLVLIVTYHYQKIKQQIQNSI